MFEYFSSKQLTAEQHAYTKLAFLVDLHAYYNNVVGMDLNEEDIQQTVDDIIHLTNMLATYNASGNTLEGLHTLINSVSALDSYVRDYFSKKFYDALIAWDEENYEGEYAED
jgi:hypothetical protein